MVTEFTPWVALSGGVLIGLASLLLMVLYGRVFGVSGVLTGAILAPGGERWNQLALVLGLIAAPSAYFALTGGFPEITIPTDRTGLVIGGVIVGIGVSLGGGCTSGHGVCGISRFSLRSVVATIVFMAVCAVTVWVTRHGFGG